MKVSVLCSDCHHPIYPWLDRWRVAHGKMHEIELVQNRTDLIGGHVLFLISCREFIDAEIRARYHATLVIHASDLPDGRGWSPHIWQIVVGKNEIPVTLLEAEDQVDSGMIWDQRIMSLEGHELYDEINTILFAIELELMDFALEHFDSIKPRPQPPRSPTFYRRRTPEDSRLEVQKSLAEQFNVLRVSDPLRFPAFFDYQGHRYLIRLEKAHDDAAD